MLRDILPQGGSRSDRSVQKNLMETLMEGKMILRGGDTVKDEGMHDTQCLKIKEKVSFNIASEVSYIYKSSLKMPKMANFAEFLKT